MANWEFLEKHRVVTGHFASTKEYGFNGCFRFWAGDQRVNVIASDGEGWQHVSVSLNDHPDTPPKWGVMCAVKDLFWNEEDVVVQFHPRKSNYVNFHKGCLHLWRCIDGREQPTPPSILVGPKT